jgi:hypothetical protein
MNTSDMVTHQTGGVKQTTVTSVAVAHTFESFHGTFVVRVAPDKSINLRRTDGIQIGAMTSDDFFELQDLLSSVDSSGVL